jgi:hypothetical protein
MSHILPPGILLDPSNPRAAEVLQGTSHVIFAFKANMVCVTQLCNSEKTKGNNNKLKYNGG